MERLPIQSSNLASVGYDAGTGTMELEFHSGRVYQYFDVPPAVYQGLLAAESKGQYFHDNIKGVYRYARV